jgi:hypothetical protein
MNNQTILDSIEKALDQYKTGVIDECGNFTGEYNTFLNTFDKDLSAQDNVPLMVELEAMVDEGDISESEMNSIIVLWDARLTVEAYLNQL